MAVDTNILVHLYDDIQQQTRIVAEQLTSQEPVISQQVITEYLNISRRLLPVPKDEVLRRCNLVFAVCKIAPTTHSTLALAARLLARYDFQLFDSIVVAAALEANCTTLYSADFQHNQLIEGRLRIINPFV
ncbi:PIN domain-containing protein [uncultured Hymenobacter sp.]|uniref:PIN domain-containing protein n=1 Tax=uncultured Hymenobacter sp. TaxID=170016 RepID=UPI0035CBA957